MTLADDLERLAQLRSTGALSDFEFEAAKRKLLSGESDSAAAHVPVEHLSDIRQQNEVAQLDRQWQIDREKYRVHGKYGSRFPTKGSSVAQGLIIGLFGTFWTVAAMSMSVGFAGSGAPPMAGMFAVFFPLFGVLFTLFGIYSAISGYGKAQAYEAAQLEYEEKRRRLMDRQ